MSMLLESARQDPYAKTPEVLAMDKQPTIYDRLRTVVHNAVEYVGDKLPAPTPRQLRALIVAGTALAAMGAIEPTVATAAPKGKKANTVIEVQEGIGGVDIGQTRKQVEEEAGNPAGGKSATKANVWYYTSKAPFAELSFGDNKRVDYISPNSTRDKTSTGIGEDASEEQVQAAYSDATCSQLPGPGGTSDLSCGITEKLPGGKTLETAFTFGTPDGSGGVSTISIAEF